MTSDKPNYRLDAPVVVRNLLVAGGAGPALAAGIARVLKSGGHALIGDLRQAYFVMFAFSLIVPLKMLKGWLRRRAQEKLQLVVVHS